MLARCLLVAAAVACALCAHRTFAQIPRIGPSLDQLQRPREVPLPIPEPDAQPPRLRLPQRPEPVAPSLAEGARVHARGFRFTGNTIFSDVELQALAAPFVGRDLGNLELDDLRVRITRHYVDAGYINSGAVIPDQDVSEGIVTLRIVEGRLSEIVIGGEHRYDVDFLRKRIAIGAPAVLNVNRLQEHLQVLLQDPLIDRVGAELAPGVNPGEAVLRADVTSAPVFVAGVTLSNERPPSVGADQIEGSFALRNLLGRGELFSFRPSRTEGLRDYAYGLTLPLSAYGTTLSIRTERTDSRIVEAPLDQLDITAQSTSIEAGITQPLIAQPRRTLNVSASVAKRKTESFFLGEPSPFIPGAPDGRTTIGLIRLGLDGVDRTPERVLAGRLQISHGIDAFGATIAEGGLPDSRFTALLAQFQWVQRVAAPGSHFVLRAETQRTDDRLLGPEKYSIGGVDSVRGYRKDLFVRDSGWLASIEYRHLLTYLPIRSGNAAQGEGALHIAVFADTARAWDRDSTAGVARIASIGPGIRWEPMAGVEAQVYYGNRLHNVTTPTRTLQDKGFHLRFSATRAF